MEQITGRLRAELGIRVKNRVPLDGFTTMKVGGLARYFITVRSEEELGAAISAAKEFRMRWYVVGAGSNLVPLDKGFDGFIIKNEIEHLTITSGKVQVGAGNNLLRFIFSLDAAGLKGLEKMAGIPGTIGGAIYGAAGAYGQEIKDCLARVKILDASTLPARSPKQSHRIATPPHQRAGGGAHNDREPLNSSIRWLSKKQCHFGYRESIFKKKKSWIILAAEVALKKADPGELLKTSQDIITLREKKYPPGLLCPGSFFKNIVVADIKPSVLRRKFLSKIAPEKIMYGKVPTGYLLETVGAKAMRSGDVIVAAHHGNLIYNAGRGKTRDILRLARRLKRLVKKRFGIELKEEIQYL